MFVVLATLTMTEVSSAEEKIALIYENLAEVLKDDLIKDVVLSQKRSLKIYWGLCLKELWAEAT